jgi:hypothetical protein
MTSSISPLIPILAGCLLAAGCLFGTFYNLRRKRLVDDTPTSKTQGVFIGVSELKGSAESEHPFQGYLSGGPSVLYDWIVEEHWQRTVVETSTDSKGHVQTRTRSESGWKKVAGGGESAPFYLRDDSGIILIRPEGAKINPRTTFNQTVKPDSSLYYDKGPASEIPNSTHQRRLIEHAIPLHEQLYVIGQARLRDDLAAAEIAYDKNCLLYLISLNSEKQIVAGYSWGMWGFFLGGLLVALGSAIGWRAADSPSALFDPLTLILAALIYAAVFVLLWAWTAFNSLINQHHRVEQAWSQVEIQLKRRFDLIPNLMKVVEGYRGHEAGTLELLSALRGQMEATPPGQPGPDYKGLASVLRIAVENYPDLKASENFLGLQNSLVETEEKIALARDYYNQTTTFYNTRISIVPDRLIAALARLRPASLMGAQDFERAPVKVNLSA